MVPSGYGWFGWVRVNTGGFLWVRVVMSGYGGYGGGALASRAFDLLKSLIH